MQSVSSLREGKDEADRETNRWIFVLSNTENAFSFRAKLAGDFVNSLPTLIVIP